MDKLDFVAREIAVVDGVMANGLVDNGQFKLALAYVLDVLKDREEVSARPFCFLSPSLGGYRRSNAMQHLLIGQPIFNA